MTRRERKIKLALIFGGESTEHEVSVLSARNIYAATNKDTYEIALVGISHTGEWILFEEEAFEKEQFATVEEMQRMQSGDRSKSPLSPIDILKNCDVVFSIIHGTLGEDGSLQGMCQMMHMPFVGPGVLGSAVSMDKDVAKRLLKEAGVLVSRARVVRSGEAIESFADIQRDLGDIIFVKPANSGSSVGVSRVSTEQEYTEAVESAFLYDTKILIEENIQGREVECAVLGNENPEASVVGEVVPNNKEHTFYSYSAKYLDDNGAIIVIPAYITSEQSKEIQELSRKVFSVLCCEGMARVDFFLTEDGKIIVNEVNTLPGFTSISMYPKLWEASGVAYSDLIDKLITYAFERHERDKKLHVNTV